jgi:DNA invertase Pin-like site-specific DNA recombinase
MKYFIYTRKSTDSEERQILSIESQLAELREFAAKEKLEIVASLCEAQTAKEPGRKIFGEMLDRIEKGEAGGILAWHPDRLARNSIDGGKIIYLLDTGKIKDLKFPTFWFDLTPQGKFMMNIAFGQSKYYIDNLSENIKRGHRQKLRKGIWPGFAPLGYLNNHKTKAIDTDKEKSPVIRKCFELYSTGEYTLKSIKQFLADTKIDSHKGNVLSCSCVQRMLKNPFYYGVFKFNGEIYQGSHEPIISKKLFDSVQQVMNNRGKKKRKRKHEFAFSGLMRCGNCGCLITAETQKGHNYYRCTKKKQKCEEKYLREENLVEQMKGIIQKVSLPDDWVNNMLAEIDKEKEQAREETKVFVQNLQEEKSEVEQKMDKLLDLFIDGKGITPEEYQTKKQKMLNEKLDIEQKIKDFEQMGNNWLEPMRKMIFEAKQAKILLSQGDNQQILTFLKNVGSNFILKDKKFNFCFKIGWRARVAGEPNASFSNWR